MSSISYIVLKAFISSGDNSEAISSLLPLPSPLSRPLYSANRILPLFTPWHLRNPFVDFCLTLSEPVPGYNTPTSPPTFPHNSLPPPPKTFACSLTLLFSFVLLRPSPSPRHLLLSTVADLVQHSSSPLFILLSPSPPSPWSPVVESSQRHRN